jgi:hypothetical protein
MNAAIKATVAYWFSEWPVDYMVDDRAIHRPDGAFIVHYQRSLLSGG